MKIMQSFILMQNTYKRDWIGGGEIFGSLFFKKQKKQKKPILANIGSCPNFLD